MPPPRRLLCIEDDPDIRLILQLALETVGGYQLQLCASGPEALAAFPDFRPDVILLDVMLPGMDGPAVLKELRKLMGAAAVPVIFLTAKVQPAEIEQFKSLGALGVIAKPFDPMSLAQQIAAFDGARG